MEPNVLYPASMRLQSGFWLLETGKSQTGLAHLPVRLVVVVVEARGIKTHREIPKETASTKFRHRAKS